MLVTDNLTGAGVQSAVANAQDSGALASDFDTFLKLLTSQIRNQDPLNPADSTEFVAQLATFSNVEQSVQTNDLLKSMSGQMAVQSMGQLASWVGMDARAVMPVYHDGSEQTLYIAPPAVADKIELVVKDEDGVEVQRIAVEVGKNQITWDGTAPGQADVPDGIYQFQIESSAGDQPLSATPVETFARVQEATQANGQVYLVFSGDIAVASSVVQGLRSPQS